MDDKYRSRKFGIAVACLILASIFLSFDKLAGSEWVTCVTFILGLYGVANVMDKKQ